MTEMRRITISIPDDMNVQLEQLMKSSRFANCSCSEVIRRLMVVGIKSEERRKKRDTI